MWTVRVWEFPASSVHLYVYYLEFILVALFILFFIFSLKLLNETFEVQVISYFSSLSIDSPISKLHSRTSSNVYFDCELYILYVYIYFFVSNRQNVLKDSYKVAHCCNIFSASLILFPYKIWIKLFVINWYDPFCQRAFFLNYICS